MRRSDDNPTTRSENNLRRRSNNDPTFRSNDDPTAKSDDDPRTRSNNVTARSVNDPRRRSDGDLTRNFVNTLTDIDLTDSMLSGMLGASLDPLACQSLTNKSQTSLACHCFFLSYFFGKEECCSNLYVCRSHQARILLDGCNGLGRWHDRVD